MKKTKSLAAMLWHLLEVCVAEWLGRQTWNPKVAGLSPVSAGGALGNPEFNSSATLIDNQPNDSPPASWGGTIINIIFSSFVSVGEVWERSRNKQINPQCTNVVRLLFSLVYFRFQKSQGA